LLRVLQEGEVRPIGASNAVKVEISRKHLAVRRQPGSWEVADLGSKNGILVNGEPASRATFDRWRRRA